MDCDTNDNKATWDWATLQGDTWLKHPERVANATPYLPRSFDRPPRNPADKISSGYKAWEFLMYIFGLGPGLFYSVLPRKYWQHYCKLVSGIRLIHQKSIISEWIQLAHDCLVQFHYDFELFYCRRRLSMFVLFILQYTFFLNLATKLFVQGLSHITLSGRWRALLEI